jgi:hypothetical protein
MCCTWLLQEYSSLMDVAAEKSVAQQDRFYCPHSGCSALYELTDGRWDRLVGCATPALASAVYLLSCKVFGLVNSVSAA